MSGMTCIATIADSTRISLRRYLARMRAPRAVTTIHYCFSIAESLVHSGGTRGQVNMIGSIGDRLHGARRVRRTAGQVVDSEKLI